MVILFAFQVLHGYVYAEVSLIVTAFMAGLALGGVASNRLLACRAGVARRRDPSYLWRRVRAVAVAVAVARARGQATSCEPGGVGNRGAGTSVWADRRERRLGQQSDTRPAAL